MITRNRKIIFIILLIAIINAYTFEVTQAAETTSVLGGGVAINEILINPKGDPSGFDTDNNGTVDDLDEFIELYNTSSNTIDISGWELWDSLALNWYTFPGDADDGTTLLAPGAYAVVVAGVQSGGVLPTMTNPASLIFDAGEGSPAMNNTQDNVVLYDPGADKYIQLIYNGDGVDSPTLSYPGFSASAVLINSVIDFGNDEDGKSLTRYPSGDTNIVIHDSIPGGGNASPTVIHLDKFSQASSNPSIIFIFFALFLLIGLGSLHQFRKRLV